MDWRTTDLALGRTLEMVFFAHMLMADAADQVLARHGLGRPHHRVLSFARIKPGLTVHELQFGLRITSQALSRTMRKLVALELLEQRPSAKDGRERCHYLTDKGLALLAEPTARQFEVIRQVHEACSADDIDAFWRLLQTLARPDDLRFVSPHPASVIGQPAPNP